MYYGDMQMANDKDSVIRLFSWENFLMYKYKRQTRRKDDCWQEIRVK